MVLRSMNEGARARFSPIGPTLASECTISPGKAARVDFFDYMQSIPFPHFFIQRVPGFPKANTPAVVSRGYDRQTPHKHPRLSLFHPSP